jgi:hypothetical protein
LTVSQGGTGLVTITANGLMTGNGTGNVTIISAGTTGNVLTSNGTAWLSTAPTAQVYPGAGIANSTGTAWGTSYTTNGTGTVVALITSPTFVTPTIGVATATSVNKVTITAPATSATLTLANASSLITSGAFSQTLTATANTSVTLPTSGTIMSSVTALSGAVTGTPSSTTYLRGDATWATVSGGGGSPGGSNTQIQYNSSGSFAGSANLSFDGVSLLSGATTPAYFAGVSNLLQFSINRNPNTGAIFNSAQSCAFMNVDGASGGSSFQFATATAANTQPTETLRLNSNGALVLKGGNTSATGVGVAFPATQDASSDANTLDDYEEGTWTPVVTPNSGTLTSYTSNGTYIKIGKFVFIWFQFSITSAGTASGIATVASLPFSTTANNGTKSTGTAREDNVTGTFYGSYAASSGTQFQISQFSSYTLGLVWTNGYGYNGTLVYQTTN